MGPLKLLAPLGRMLLSEYLVLCRFLLSVGFAGCLVCRMCSLVLIVFAWGFVALPKKLIMWIASLPSAFQIIRCLRIWMSILLVISWGLDPASKLGGWPKYFKCVTAAFLEGSSRDLCWPGHGLVLTCLHPEDKPRTPVLSSCRTVFPKGLWENLILTRSIWFLEMLWWVAWDLQDYLHFLLKGQGIWSQFLYTNEWQESSQQNRPAHSFCMVL